MAFSVPQDKSVCSFSFEFELQPDGTTNLETDEPRNP
jgi:hypothetical protein